MAAGTTGGPGRAEVETIVASYFDGIRRGDAGALAALFADDGELVTPVGRFVGGDAVAGFYENVFAMGETAPLPGPVLVEGNRAAVEIVLELGGNVSRYGDFFTLGTDGDGHVRIDRLVIYQGGPA